MQKRVMFIAILLLAICNKIVAAGGTDLISISDFSLYSGGTKEVSVVMTNTDNYVGFQFDLVLPEGITVDSLSASERIPQGTSLQMAQQTDGSYRFIAYAQNRLPITGNDGAIMTLTLKASESVVPNSYTGYLRNVKMSTLEGTGLTVVEQSFAITVSANTPEAYAVLTGDTILTFYYDKKKEERNGMGVGPFSNAVERSWDTSSSNITSVVLDDTFAGYNPTSTAYWFSGFSSLTSISGIANLKTDNVTNMEAMFNFCKSLSSLDVSGFNTSNVINMSSMFSYLEAIKTLDLSRFNTANVTNMHSMFESCPSLESLTLGAMNTENVTIMHSMFQGCSSLTTIDVSSFNTQRLTDMSRMFHMCSSLKTIYVGSGWTTAAIDPDNGYDSDMSNIGGGKYVFYGCSNLVGGLGTIYDDSHTDYTYAHIDGGASNPGYLTDINAPNSYTVTLDVSDGGAVTVNHEFEDENGKMTFTVAPGDSLDFIIIPQDGFQLTSVMVDTLNVTNDVRKIEGSESLIYTLQKIYQNHNVHVSFTELGHVAMPTIISWSGDTLRAVSSTEGAIVNCILRQTSNGPVAQWSGGPDPQLTLPIESDLFVELFATKEGLLTSDTLKFYYPYTAWHQLTDAINDANTVLAAAANNDNVTDADRNALSSLIEAAQQSYAARTETESAVKARTDELVAQTAIVRQLVEAVNEPYAVLSENNTVLTFYYDKKKEERGGMDVVPFNDINQRGWHEQRENITRVVFDDSFADCDTLTSTASWFAECGNLTTIENLNLLKTANVENMSSMFWNCSSLTSLDLSNFNTANVTNMHDMFWGCSSLTSLDLSNFNTSNVTIMDGLFAYCSYLSSVGVSNFNTTNVTNMMFMFDGCSSLTSLDVSNFNTANVTEMTSMFADCHSLTILDLSNFNTANVTSMWSMFWGNSSLETIFVGDGWSMEKVENSTTMFNGCTALRGGAGTTYSEEHIDGTYAHIDGGVSNPGYFTDKNAPVIDDNIIQFADAAVKAICVEKWDADGDGELSKAEAAAVTSLNKAFNQNVDIISFEEFRYFTGVTMLVEWEFYNCSNLKKIVLPPHLQSIEDHAFYYCGIDSIVLPASVTNITDAGMYGCFKNIDVDADNPMFCSIDGVLFSKDATVIRNYPVRRYDESYTVPSTVTAIGGCAFYGSRLREIVVPDGVTRFEAGAFRYCRELENIVIPATVDSIFNENFQYCDALTSVMIPANVKYMADDVLSVCSNLKEILVDVDNQNYRSLDGVLYDKDVTRLRIYPANYQTESYVVPDDVTSMYFFAFNRAKNIQAITLPQSLTNISRFDDSKNLTSVTVHWQEPLTLGANTDYFHENTLTNGTLYVPYGTKSLYEQTEGWNKFQNIVEMEAPAVNATFDNHGVLTVGGTATMTEALETVGGVSVVAETITAIVWNSTATLTNSDLQGLDNPNMLVYVQSASQAPANRDNVVIGNDSTGYTAKNIKLKDVAEGNGDFYCPIAFTAEMISYTHNYSQQTEVGVSRGWETIALPFAVQTVTHERNGVIAPFGNSASGKHFWLRQLTQSGLQPATTIEANMPYLISMPNNTDLYAADFNQGGRVTFTAENAAVPVTTQHVTALADSTILFVPTTMQVGRSSDVWALNVGQVRGANLEGSVFERDFREVRPFEAYTVHRSNTPAPRFVPINDINGGNLTGISDASLVNSEKVNNEKWYDLNGRQLQQKPTKGGVYILNGKKVVLR